MEDNFRRVPPPPPPRPNIPRPPQPSQPVNSPLQPQNDIQSREKQQVKEGKKRVNPFLRLTFLIIGAVLAFVGMGICAYFTFV